jgi:ketosteroid isomerase-like protein
MASVDHDTARAMFDAWNSGNVDRMIEFWSEDGDWIWEDMPDAPDAQVFRGRESVEAHLREMIGVLGGMEIHVNELVDLDDELLAVTRTTVRGAQSGIELDAAAYHVINFEDGQVRRYRVFTDREEAMRAAEAG